MEREELTSLLHAVYAAIAVGLVVGVLTTGLLLLLGSHTPLGTGARGLGLIIAIIGVLAGYAMQAAVERAAGFSGGLLAIPISAGAIVTVGTVAAAAELWALHGESPMAFGTAGMMWVVAVLETAIAPER
ncbi:MAG: hypothetical protein AB1716_03755 [Planctomycetota bacterium]